MSRSNIAYPYPVLTASDVELRVDSVEVDGLRQELNLISDREQVVALHHVKKQQWSSIILRVTVAVRGDEIGEGPWELPKCVAILRNRKTHVRRSVELDSCGQGRGMWTGEVEMYSDEHIGRTELDAQLVARVQGIEGRVIGTAVHRWTVDLEARRPTKERSIRMVWRDFTDESDPQLFTYRDDPWLVEAAGDEPTIFLNSAVEGLRTVLEGGGGGAEKILRETLATQIASEAWVCLFNTAVYASSANSKEPMWWPGGWQEDVLRRMLPDVFPDLSPDDALTEALQRRLDGHGGGDLQMRVTHAAAIQAMRSRKITAALRSLVRTGSDAGKESD